MHGILVQPERDSHLFLTSYGPADHCESGRPPLASWDTSWEAHLPKLSSRLYRLSRRTNDAEVLLSGDPKRMERRVKNKLIGRALGRVKFWRALWR